MKLLVGLVVLAAIAFIAKKMLNKKNVDAAPANNGSGNGSGNGIGSGGSSIGIINEFPPIKGSGSGSGSGNGIGSGGSSTGIDFINPGGPTSGSGSGSGAKGAKGAGLLDPNGNDIKFDPNNPPSDFIKKDLK